MVVSISFVSTSITKLHFTKRCTSVVLLLQYNMVVSFLPRDAAMLARSWESYFCPSVCHTRALWQNQTMHCRYFDTTRKGNHSSQLIVRPSEGDVNDIPERHSLTPVVTSNCQNYTINLRTFSNCTECCTDLVFIC